MTEQEINQLRDLRTEISTTKKKILALQEEMKKLEDAIYLKCEHEWEKDRANVGEHTEYICIKCNLSNK